MEEPPGQEQNAPKGGGGPAVQDDPPPQQAQPQGGVPVRRKRKRAAVRSNEVWLIACDDEVHVSVLRIYVSLQRYQQLLGSQNFE